MILEIDRYISIPAIIIFWVLIPAAIFFGLARFKIIENNSTKLMFAFRPVLRLTLASILTGTGATIMLILLFHNYSVDLTCNKIAGVETNIKCNLSTKSIVIRHQNQFIPDLQSARLNFRKKKSEEDEVIAEPVLITSQEEINLFGLFGSSDIKKVNKIVNDINLFIDASEQKLTIIKDESIFLIPFLQIVLFLTVSSLLIVTLSSYRYCLFNSETQEFISILKSFFREEVIAEASLQEIERVRIEICQEDLLVRRVLLCLRSGQRFSIAGTANNYQYHNSVAKLIRQFLKQNNQNSNQDE